MKILYLIDSLQGGGAEKLLYDMIPRLSKDIQSDVFILSAQGEKYLSKLRSKHVNVIVKPDDVRNPVAIISLIGKIIKNGNYDIVHANLFPITYYCAVAKKRMGHAFPILVMTEHSTDNRRRHIRWMRMIEKWIYSSYDAIISISPQTKEALNNWLCCQKDSKKHFVVDNGVDLAAFMNAIPYRKEELAGEFQNGDYLLCIVGSLKPLKNHLQMIEIMCELPDNYRLLIVGEGPQRDVIIEHIKSSGLEHRVKLLGFRDDVERIIATSHLVVIPSKWEGFGLVAVESMACGVPVVVSNVKGLSDVVGNAGIKATTVKEFVDGIRLFEDNDDYRMYSQRARKRAMLYDIARTTEEYEKLYNLLLRTKSI